MNPSIPLSEAIHFKREYLSKEPCDVFVIKWVRNKYMLSTMTAPGAQYMERCVVYSW